MAYSEQIARRIKNSLVGISNVEEKKMFGGLAFMVNGKMCITAGPDRMMCRIDPDIHDREIQKEGCTTVVMGGRTYKGYIYIEEEILKEERDYHYWIKLALDFNGNLISSKD